MGKPVHQEGKTRPSSKPVTPNRQPRRHSVLTDYYSKDDLTGAGLLSVQTSTKQQQQQSDLNASQDGSSVGEGELPKSKGVAGKKITGPFHNAKYKAKMCKNWEREGKCPYEEKCQFAHGEEEMNHWAYHRSKTQNAKSGRYAQRQNKKPLSQHSGIPMMPSQHSASLHQQQYPSYAYGAYDVHAPTSFSPHVHGSGQYGAHAHARASATVDFGEFSSSPSRFGSTQDSEYVGSNQGPLLANNQAFQSGPVSPGLDASNPVGNSFAPNAVGAGIGPKFGMSPAPSHSKQRRASYQHTYPAPDYNMFESAVMHKQPSRAAVESLAESLARFGTGFGSNSSTTGSVSGRSTASSEALSSDQHENFAPFTSPTLVGSEYGLSIPSSIEESEENVPVSLLNLLDGAEDPAYNDRVSPIASPIGSAPNSPTTGPSDTQTVSPRLELNPKNLSSSEPQSTPLLSNNDRALSPPPALFSSSQWGLGKSSSGTTSPNVMTQLFQGDSRLVDLKDIM